MAQRVVIPSPQNYYFKDSVAYTEDHIPVQKIHMFGLPPKLNKFALEVHFGMYGHVLRLHIFKPRNEPGEERRYSRTGYVFFAQKTDAAKALHSRIHHLNGIKFHVQASDSWHQPDAYGMPRHLPVYLPNTKPPPPPPVMSLNDHCLEHILMYLQLPDQIHFARTCLRFRAVYQMATARLHKFIDLFQFGNMTVWDMRDFFRLSGAYVDKIYGVMPKTHPERLCDFLANNCRNLKTMAVFGGNTWSGRNIQKVFAKMNQLESLHLPMSNINDQSVLALRNLHKLKTLDLSGNPFIGETLAKLPNTIESLTLNDCKYLEVGYLMKILKTFHALKELNMRNLDPNGVEIYEQMIKEKCCLALETLRMSGYGYRHYEFVAQIPSLKNLSIVIKRGLRAQLFEQLAEHKAKQLERLEVLGVDIVTQPMLCNIAKLSELRYLKLPQIQSYATLADAIGSNGLQNLERLAVRQSGCFSEQAILKIFRACPKLSCLDLEDFNKSREQLVLDIVSCVQQEIANKDMRRKLPIKLWNVPAIVKANSEKFPKDIIQIKRSHERDDDLFNPEDFDDYAFDPDDWDLDEDTDDEFQFEQDMYDMGFLSDDDDDDDDDGDDDDDDNEYFNLGLAAGGYVHPSWPYDSDGDFIGFGLDDD